MLRNLLVTSLAVLNFSFAHAAKVEKGAVTIGETTVPYWIQLPDKIEGKIPAMLILHGSNGVSQRFWDYAAEFNKLGVAAVIIDSFGPRHVRSSVENQKAIPLPVMERDTLTVLQVVAKHPKIDGDKIGAIGFSKGAGVLLNRTILAFTNHPGDKQLALSIAMYPPCNNFRLHPKTTGKPIRVLVGDHDTYNNWRDCQQVAAKYKEFGANIEIVTLAGAQHAWDAPGHFNDPKGENWSQCRWDQISDKVWEQRSTHIVIEDENGPNKANFAKAASNCMTRGISGGYNANAAVQSFGLINGYVNKILKGK
jgi:dienelactone hydrolase